MRERSASGRAPIWRSRNVLALGLTSFLSDTASDMIAPLLPLFLATLPSGGALALGWIEGASDAVSSLLKLASGAWSDRARRRTPIVALGYALAACTRPLMALAQSASHVAFVRVGDRIGKGVRTSPRDALLAASVPASQRGEAFGFHRALDHAGAVVGPLVALAVLAFWADDLRLVFALAAIPGLLSVALLYLLVRERPRTERVRGRARLQRPTRDELRVLAPIALFTLGAASDLFLLLQAAQVAGLERARVALPLLWVALHLVKLGSSWIGGRCSDRFGPRRVIAAGWISFASIYLALALSDDPAVVLALCVVAGVYHGLTEGPEKALVAELARRDGEGSAFGWYHLVVGACSLPASVVFGVLWERFGSGAAFVTSATIALLATALLWFARPQERAGSGIRDGTSEPSSEPLSKTEGPG